MSKPSHQRDWLVIRPWLASWPGGETYARLDGLPMRTVRGQPRCYGDLEVLLPGDAPRVPHLDGFRIGCQVDDRRSDAYAWSWGYRPELREIFGAADLERKGPSITAVDRGLARLDASDGPARSIGHLALRVARVLKLDGIVLLPISPDGSFRAEMIVRRCFAGDAIGEAVGVVDALVTKLHQHCAGRVARLAA